VPGGESVRGGTYEGHAQETQTGDRRRRLPRVRPGRRPPPDLPRRPRPAAVPAPARRREPAAAVVVSRLLPHGQPRPPARPDTRAEPRPRDAPVARHVRADVQRALLPHRAPVRTQVQRPSRCHRSLGRDRRRVHRRQPRRGPLHVPPRCVCLEQPRGDRRRDRAELARRRPPRGAPRRGGRGRHGAVPRCAGRTDGGDPRRRATPGRAARGRATRRRRVGLARGGRRRSRPRPPTQAASADPRPARRAPPG
jgi:hypothetical protein